MLKKVIAVATALTVMVVGFTGCGQQSDTVTAPDSLQKTSVEHCTHKGTLTKEKVVSGEVRKYKECAKCGKQIGGYEVISPNKVQSYDTEVKTEEPKVEEPKVENTYTASKQYDCYEIINAGNKMSRETIISMGYDAPTLWYNGDNVKITWDSFNIYINVNGVKKLNTSYSVNGAYIYIGSNVATVTYNGMEMKFR